MLFEEDEKEALEMSNAFSSRSFETIALESVISVVVTGTAAVGNILFCVAVFRDFRLRVPRNYFIISLAVSDVMMSLLVMPLSTGAFIWGSWPYGDFMCQFQGSVGCSLGSVALLTLTLTAVNRYFKMVKGLNLYQKLYTKKTTLCMITCAWILGFLVPMPYLLSSGNRFVFHPGKAMCYVSFQTETKTYSVIVMVLLVAGPFSIISVCYWKVFWRVRQHSRQVFAARNKPVPGLPSGSTPSIEEIKITKLLLALVFTFTVCWAPFIVVDLISFFRGDYVLPRWVYVFYINMVASNSSLNPLIYGVMNRQIRRAMFTRVLCS